MNWLHTEGQTVDNMPWLREKAFENQKFPRGGLPGPCAAVIEYFSVMF